MKIIDLRTDRKYLIEYIKLCNLEWGKPLKEEELNLKAEKKANAILSKENDNIILVLGLIEDEDLLGFIALLKEDQVDIKDMGPWYGNMYVKKEYRNKGYSKILNDAILKEARKLNYDKVYLKTSLNNYYEKFGAEYIKNLNDEEKLYCINLMYLNLKVRTIKAEEVNKLSHLYNDASNPLFMKSRKEKILSGIQDIYVLEFDNNIIGEVSVIYNDIRESFTIKNQRVYMEGLRVEKKHQGKGYSQIFINRVIEDLEKKNYKEITIGVEDDNLNARHIYKKLGFTNFVKREPGDKHAPQGYDVWLKKVERN
jgi:diamine N-acetyltransferase